MRPLTLISFFFLIPSLFAQPHGNVAYFELLRINPGQESKFEETLKRHWAWHARQGETWKYFVSTVASGGNVGAYQIASFGHTWEEVAASAAQVAGTPEPAADPSPFHQSVQELYYAYRPDLSASSEPEHPAAITSLTRVLVKPESLSDFEAALKKIVENARQTPSKSGPRWYQLVTGGDWPQFLLLEDRASWTGFANQSALDAIRQSTALNKQELDAFWKSLRSVSTEALEYRSDLSRTEVAIE
jgi:quinol monooxygenase YgiN